MGIEHVTSAWIQKLLPPLSPKLVPSMSLVFLLTSAFLTDTASMDAYGVELSIALCTHEIKGI